jgi:hypothetical protein
MYHHLKPSELALWAMWENLYTALREVRIMVKYGWKSTYPTNVNGVFQFPNSYKTTEQLKY